MLKKIQLYKLGGLNNRNYLFESNNTKYVIRIPSKDNKNNFNYESIILKKIKHLNITPKIIYNNKSNGILVSEFIENSNLSINSYKDKNFIFNLSLTLKKLHNIKCNIYFDPFNHIESNIFYLNNIKFKFDHNINKLLEKYYLIKNKLINNPTYGLCHCDLNSSNILYKNNYIYLIDFEFSGICDIFFDLATISWFLDEPMKIELLTSYFGYYNLDLKEKLEDYIFIVKLWNATWSYKKSINNNSSYDYKLGANMILDNLLNL